MTLDGLEEALVANWPSTKKGKAQVYLTRYADDFVITANQRKILEKDIKPKVEAFLTERGLSLSPEKTVITHIDEGFDFLGQNVRKYDGKLLIMPTKGNVQRFLAKVQKTIQNNLHTAPQQLINLLNPMIRGWANYHRHVVSKDTYSKVDSRIFWMLWRWAKRRHPNKRKDWIRRRYFTSLGNRQWVFFDQLPSDGEKQRIIRLFRASEVPIERHHQIRQAANPYDPAWELYFEQRRQRKMENDLQHRRRLSTLWQQQERRCPCCKQPITTETKWDCHHIIWQANGGSDTLDNLILLHPNCHRQLHNQGLTVEKPQSAKTVC